MRVKLFLALGSFILISLLSNMAFRNLVVREFEDYSRGDWEEGVYLVQSALESHAERGGWSHAALNDVTHWSLLLGYEITVLDGAGQEVADTATFLEQASPLVLRRLTGLGAVPLTGRGEFQSHPLYLRGDVIGTVKVRESRGTAGRELRVGTFKERSHLLLVMSVAGTGLVALVVGTLFINYLLRPIGSLTRAVRRVQDGDLTARAQFSRSSDEISQLGQAFNAMVETLQRQETRQKNLVTDLAHELRTPISIISGTIEAVQDGVTPMNSNTLQSLHEEADRMRRLVAGIETVAREESGFFFLNRRDVDMVSLIRLASESLRPLFTKKGIQLVVSTPNTPLKAHADPDKIEQVLHNLLSNALRHTETGEVTVSLGKDGGDILIEVSDTGTGIPPEDRSRIFERFQKGENSDGLGIGLTIVRSIVEAHGGTVRVSDNAGKGSRFQARFPA